MTIPPPGPDGSRPDDPGPGPNDIRRLLNSGAVPVVVLFGAILFGIYKGPDWQAEASTRTVMEGTCRAEIDGRPVPCGRSVTLLQVAGGALSMFVFEPRDAIYGLLGKSWQQQPDGSFRLEVDRVDLGPPHKEDDPFIGARGQCLVQTRGGLSGPFSVIDCTAEPIGRLRRLKFHLEQIDRFERKNL
jgi:hypothetical protein